MAVHCPPRCFHYRSERSDSGLKKFTCEFVKFHDMKEVNVIKKVCHCVYKEKENLHPAIWDVCPYNISGYEDKFTPCTSCVHFSNADRIDKKHSCLHVVCGTCIKRGRRSLGCRGGCKNKVLAIRINCTCVGSSNWI